MGPLVILPRGLNDLIEGVSPVEEDWEGQVEVRVSPGSAVIFDTARDESGTARWELVNPACKVGVEVAYATEALSRRANWQHYGPGGSYV